MAATTRRAWARLTRERARSFTRVTTLALAAALAGCGRREPPNIVLIVVDTLRADSLSSDGYPRPISPGIESLARESVVFPRAFTVGSNTSTSMAALMTGRLPFYADTVASCRTGDCVEPWDERTWFGMQRFHAEGEIGLPAGLDTLAELLKRRGYGTAAYVSNALLKTKYKFDQGFDDYEEPLLEDCSVVTAGAKRWLRRRKDDGSPFLLFLHYIDPHAPYLAPTAYRQRVAFRRTSVADEQLFAGPGVKHGVNRDVEGFGSDTFREHLKGLYDSEILYTDECVGRVVEYLRRQPYYANTLIVFLSDHGEEFLDHGGTGHPGRFYDEHVRVPLIIRVPKRSFARTDVLVRHFDVMPTLLEYAGVSPPPGIDAVSLRPLLEGKVDSLDLGVYANFPFPQTRRMYRTGRYKLIVNVKSPEETELFDLSADPAESRNLYGGPSDQRAADLKRAMDGVVAKLSREGTSASSADPVELDAETREQLRALGYIQ
jgi:arylsulfatase A-like enzyme